MTESSTTATQAAPAPIITISNVWKYFGSLPALQDVSLDVATGERVVIIGPSGSGKSTLLRSINRLEEIDQGSIVVKGQNIMSPDNDINLVRQNLGMVFQQFNLFPHKTVLENLTLAPIKLRKLSREEAESRALGLLKKVGISDKANVYPAMLSGGQQQRVAIARAIVTNPRIILADEPTGNLDSTNGNEVMSLLKELNRDGATVVMVTHSEENAREAERIIRMMDGYILTESKNIRVVDA